MAARRGSTHELVVRLEAFEARFGMSTSTFVERYDTDGEVEGIHPHIASLWIGAYRILCRMGRSEVAELEAQLA